MNSRKCCLWRGYCAQFLPFSVLLLFHNVVDPLSDNWVMTCHDDNGLNTEPLPYSTGSPWCLREQIANVPHWSMFVRWRNSNDVSHCPCLFHNKTERWLAETAYYRRRCCRGSRRRGNGAGEDIPPPKKKQKMYFSGNHVKFRHFVNFSYINFRAKMSCPLKLTELLRLWMLSAD